MPILCLYSIMDDFRDLTLFILSFMMEVIMQMMVEHATSCHSRQIRFMQNYSLQGNARLI